jgi:hypothetical protein
VAPLVKRTTHPQLPKELTMQTNTTAPKVLDADRANRVRVSLANAAEWDRKAALATSQGLTITPQQYREYADHERRVADAVRAGRA